MNFFSTPPRTVGMDLGDKYSHLYVIEADGEASETTRIATTVKAMTTYFSRCPQSRVALEVGTHSRWVSELVSGFEHEVLVANPRKLRAIYENDSKSDHSDPQILAEIARVQPSLLRPIKHRGKESQAALSVVRARDCLVAVRTKLINHVRGTVKAIGSRLPKSSSASFHKHDEEIPQESHDALQPLMTTVREMTAKIREYDGKIVELCKTQFPETAALQQVSGVGPVTALAYVTTLEDPSRFPQSRKVGAFIGLRPRLDQSGQINKQLRITKAGDPLLRRLLVGSAGYILGRFGPDTDLRRWGLKLAGVGGKNAKKRATVAVARKLSVLLMKLWRSGEAYEPLRLSDKQLPSDAPSSTGTPDSDVHAKT